MGYIFGINSDTIFDEATQKDIPNWDSLNALLLIDAIEKEYNTKFSIEEVIQISNVKDIKDILRRHGVTTF